jgi:hypothetical protein
LHFLTRGKRTGRAGPSGSQKLRLPKKLLPGLHFFARRNVLGKEGQHFGSYGPSMLLRLGS